MWLDNRCTINNDGLHSFRNREATRHVRSGKHGVRLEMFARSGHAGIVFRYKGPDTRMQWAVVRSEGMKCAPRKRPTGYWRRSSALGKGLGVKT